MCSLHRHVRICIASGEGVVVGEDHVFGAVVAEGGSVVAADDGEGVEDVGGIGAGEAVEVKVEGVEAGAQVAALLLVPDEGRAVVAEVAGEGRHVVGAVGEAQDVVAHERAGRRVVELAVVVGGRDDLELLYCVPGQVSALNFLASDVVERHAVKVGQQVGCAFSIEAIFAWQKNWQSVAHSQRGERWRQSWCGRLLTLLCL